MTPAQAYEVVQQLQGVTAQIRALANQCIAEQNAARMRGEYVPIQETPSYESWQHAHRARHRLREAYKV